MAAASPQVFILLAAVLFVLSGGPLSPASCFKVAEGGVASLSCQYSVKRFGLSRVCWGRGCGTFWCSNILVQTDKSGVITKVEDRYRLTGDVLDGQMDLDILNVRRTDSGPYCCRVDIDGLFNDKKTIMNLRVVKVLVSSGFDASNPSVVMFPLRLSSIQQSSSNNSRPTSHLGQRLRDLLRRELRRDHGRFVDLSRMTDLLCTCSAP
uniref:Ig-like domain-containing protein n=1 Tax=Kryptolebias marmoratus TaxID=37003 RepID=A0A3Q3A214_KRYMA